MHNSNLIYVCEMPTVYSYYTYVRDTLLAMTTTQLAYIMTHTHTDINLYFTAAPFYVYT